MKRTHAMRAVRAEKRRKEWTRRNAALFYDTLEVDLKDSVSCARSLREVIRQEDGAALMYTDGMAEFELTALYRLLDRARELTR